MSTIEFNEALMDIENNLKSFALGFTRNMEDAKDLTQDTMLKAINYKSYYTPQTNFKAWVFTIMKNLFINDYRKKVRTNVIMDSTDNNYYINSGKHVIANEGDSNIMMDELTEIIGNLDEGLRVPFLMHYEGYKYQEIAEKFNLPIGTVKSKIFFARKELKHQIEKKYAQKFAFN